MKKSLLFILSFVGFITLEAQTLDNYTLAVVGEYNYSDKVFGYVLFISVSDETNKCDANYPMSSSEKLNHLKDFIKARQYKVLNFSDITDVTMDKSVQKYKIIFENIDDLFSLERDCAKIGVTITSDNYYFKTKDFSDEDIRANLALEDAKNKAKIYCDLFGLKIKGIRAIDDFTSLSNTLRKQNYNKYQDQLYELGRQDQDSGLEIDNYWFRDYFKSTYNLKVIFDIE